MKELLEQIQIKIIETNDLSVNEQIGVLEPLFDKVYQMCHNSDIDMMDMLKLSQLENQLTRRIIDVQPLIEPSNNINEFDKIIEQIIYYSRKKMESTYGCSIIKDTLKARSLDFSDIVIDTAKNLGVSAVKFNLMEHFELPFKHYIVIAYLENKYYLIDLTYQQYFVLGNNFKNRYYEHPTYTRVCDIGRRIMDKNLECATKMIKNGYIYENNYIKCYFDSFMELAGSNKLESGTAYLKVLINSLKGSADKSEKTLYNKMNF